MKLNYNKINRIIKRKQKGLSSKFIAQQFGISVRRVQQIWKYYLDTGTYPNLKRPGRKKSQRDLNLLRSLILAVHIKYKFKATYIAKYLRDKFDVHLSHNFIHQILIEAGVSKMDPKKQKRRKPWVRYERKHSLSAVHIDWSYYKELNVWICAVLDDSSRKILAAKEFDRPLEEYNIQVFKEAYFKNLKYRPIREVITDRGSQFTTNRKNEDGKIIGKTKFQELLDELKVKHIIARVHHPQTNGKIEKWFHLYKQYRKEFKSLKEFIHWYNNRPHGSLDLETPEKIFWERIQEFVLGGFLKWSAKI